MFCGRVRFTCKRNHVRNSVVNLQFKAKREENQITFPYSGLPNGKMLTGLSSIVKRKPKNQNYTYDNPRKNAPSNAKRCSRVEQTHSTSVKTANEFTRIHRKFFTRLGQRFQVHLVMKFSGGRTSVSLVPLKFHYNSHTRMTCEDVRNYFIFDPNN